VVDDARNQQLRVIHPPSSPMQMTTMRVGEGAREREGEEGQMAADDGRVRTGEAISPR